jgi:sulfopyruvate decarboxylase TPP-binding subunit
MPVSAEVLKSALVANDVRWLVSVANGESFNLYQAFRADPETSIVSACREGEAVGIGAGLFLGGAMSVISMENLGLFECLDTLRALPIDMGIPCILLLGYVGRGGASVAEALAGRFGNSGTQVAIAGDWTEKVLTLAEIPCRLLETPGTEAALARWAVETATSGRRPVALLAESMAT